MLRRSNEANQTAERIFFLLRIYKVGGIKCILEEIIS